MRRGTDTHKREGGGERQGAGERGRGRGEASQGAGRGGREAGDHLGGGATGREGPLPRIQNQGHWSGRSWALQGRKRRERWWG